MKRFLELRCDGGDDSQGAVAIGDVVLQDQSRPRLSYLSADHGIKVDKVYFTAPGIVHRTFVCHASSSKKNDSSDKRRSRSARRSAPSFKRFLRFDRRALVT